MIEIINKDFLLQGIITNYESVIFNRSWSGVGDFEIHINKDKQNVDKLKKGNFIMIDKKENKVGIIEDTDLDYGNTKTLTVKGKQLKSITNRRLTVTDTYDRVSETEAENVFKYYINTHAIDSYYNDIQTSERNIPWLKLAKTQNRGLRTVWQSRLEYLDVLFEHISKDTGLGWDIILDLAQKCAIFDVFEGKDRSINQTENPPIIFSEVKRNLSTSKITQQSSGSKNVGYCLGKGENEDRPIILVGNTNATGIDRKELLIDLGNTEVSEVKAEGEKKLADYTEIKSIEGKIYQIPNMEYEKDWDLGDIVTIETDGYREDKRITEIREIHERGKNKEVEVTFGDKVPRFSRTIKKINK